MDVNGRLARMKAAEEAVLVRARAVSLRIAERVRRVVTDAPTDRPGPAADPTAGQPPA
jgi:hypothetical protein